ncbi:ATP-binding protein [Mycolicibacillus koreensis]|uniref:ATP-binding protein n=1 Tax=Mycolicibacillus koreensis TaxID=1069220 RepID=UPI00138CCDCC|nr:hypothetical protein MKOR_26650 [Mycolicibacillus koreensis]
MLLAQTSNLPFSRWGQVFGEAIIASATIDLIVHHADVIALEGEAARSHDVVLTTASR